MQPPTGVLKYAGESIGVDISPGVQTEDGVLNDGAIKPGVRMELGVLSDGAKTAPGQYGLASPKVVVTSPGRDSAVETEISDSWW